MYYIYLVPRLERDPVLTRLLVLTELAEEGMIPVLSLSGSVMSELPLLLATLVSR